MQETIDLVRRAVDEGITPAAALAVGVGERALALEAFGADRFGPGAVPIHHESLFDLASLTKVVATTPVALRLAAEGRLPLDSTLAGWLPGVPPDKAGITIAHLLTHTSGLRAHIPLWQECAGPEEAVAHILAQPCEAAPGVRVEYSCIGFILLGHIAARAGGKPLDALARELVFGPLGMAHTGYNPGQPAACTESGANGVPLCGTVHDENARYLGGVSGNAGLFAPVGDVARYAAWLAAGAPGLLPPALFADAIRCHTPGMAENRGLGFKLAGGEGHFFGEAMGTAAYGHTGFTGTSLAVDPATGLWVVLLTNRVHPHRDRVNITGLRNRLHTCAAREAARLGYIGSSE